MPAWWDSIDAVSTFSWWMRWLGIGLTALGAVFGGFALASTKRVDTLKAAREAEIRDRLAPRRLRANFSNTYDIDRHENSWRALVRYKAEDEEAYAFAVNIVETMHAARWWVEDQPTPIAKDPSNDPVGAGRKPGLTPGITILCPTGQPYLDLRFEVLERDFTAAGFPPRMLPTNQFGLPMIIVGARP